MEASEDTGKWTCHEWCNNISPGISFQMLEAVKRDLIFVDRIVIRSTIPNEKTCSEQRVPVATVFSSENFDSRISSDN